MSEGGRSQWPDGRLEDRFQRAEQDLRNLRRDVNDLDEGLDEHRQVLTVFIETSKAREEARPEILREQRRRDLMMYTVPIIVALLGVIGTVLARGGP